MIGALGSQEGGVPHRRMHLLLVEDNDGDAELVRAELDRGDALDVSLVHVTRLSDAIRQLDEGAFDAVLLDLGLPDASGVQSVRRVLETHASVPVVVMTGTDDDQVGFQAVQAGAQDFLVKGAYGRYALLRSVLYAIARVRWQEQTREMVDKNVDAMVVIDEGGTVLYVNRAGEELFGLGADALVGQPFGYHMPTEGTLEIAFQRPEAGEVRVGEVRVAQIEWSGRPVVLASIRDVTDASRTRELERRLLHADRLASVGQLAAGVAHEINNPAAFVQANLEVLRNLEATIRALHADVRRRLSGVASDDALAAFDDVRARHGFPGHLDTMRDVVDDSAGGMQQITAIVRELLGFSRIDQDDVELLDLNQAVAVACRFAASEIRYRAELVTRLAELPFIAADRAKLTQVLLNLLVNAAQAIPEGEAERHRVTVETSLERDRVVVAVSDTGRGIPAENLGRVFEPFFTTKRAQDGTGLGLVIAADIVRKHRGTISVDSTVGKGTRFEVCLPLDTGLRVAQASRRPLFSDAPISARMRVLIIDDEAMLCKAMQRILEPVHDVVVACGGEEGLAALGREAPFDVVLCDLMMPRVDGLAVRAFIEEKMPALRERVVFLTGGAFTPRSKDFIASGEHLVLEKPVSSDVLHAVLNRIGRRGEPR